MLTEKIRLTFRFEYRFGFAEIFKLEFHSCIPECEFFFTSLSNTRICFRLVLCPMSTHTSYFVKKHSFERCWRKKWHSEYFTKHAGWNCAPLPNMRNEMVCLRWICRIRWTFNMYSWCEIGNHAEWNFATSLCMGWDRVNTPNARNETVRTGICSMHKKYLEHE
jgi:hypothetical protein